MGAACETCLGVGFVEGKPCEDCVVRLAGKDGRPEVAPVVVEEVPVAEDESEDEPAGQDAE